MRRALIVAAMVLPLAASPLAAAIYFQSGTLTQLAGGGPLEDLRAGLSVGDLDHDGIPDVVAPSPLGAEALIGRGDGTLSLPVVAGRNAAWSVIADFDGDGHSDIGWINGISFGDGSGQNWQIVEFSQGYRGGVAAADFDGDGRVDLAAAQWDNRIEVFLSRPGRTCQMVASAIPPETQGTRAMRVCDLNRDGRADIALLPEPSWSYDFYILLGRGDGSFDCHAQYSTSPEPHGLGIADFTGDGIPDIVLSERFMISLYRGIGDGSFAAPQIAAFDTLGEYDIAVGDVTEDGLPDLVTSDLNRSRLLVRAGHGDGTFGPRIASDLDMELLGLELADMNRDGHLDVVSLVNERPGVVVALGDGRGTFGVEPRRLTPIHEAHGVTIGDVDGDRRADVVACTHTYQDGISWLEVFLNQGLRRHGAPIVTSLFDPGQTEAAWRVHLADLDRDSHLDAVVDYEWSVQTALGNGDGTFRPLPRMDVTPYHNDLCVADANGDSLPDLIGAGPGGLRCWPGLGDGTFGTVLASPLSDTPYSIDTGDLDGDGVLDVGIGFAGGVAYAAGRGDGTFQLGPGIWLPPSPWGTGVAVGDINGDGRDDIVGTQAGSYCTTEILCGRIATRFQDPSGTLGPWVEAPWQAAYEPRIADIDGDGSSDLLCRSDLGFVVGRGNGIGGFHIEGGYGTTSLSDLCIGDLDSDGRMDAVSSGFEWLAIHYGHDPSFPVLGTPEARRPDVAGPAKILAASPNPSRSGIRVRFQAAGGPVQLCLFDAGGRWVRTLFRGVVPAQTGGTETVASIGDLGLEPGLYFLRLSTSAGVDTRRVVFLR